MTSHAFGGLAGSWRTLLTIYKCSSELLTDANAAILKLRLRQSMRIYLKNNPAKFHLDPI